MKKFWQILGVLCLMLALAAGAAAATYEPIEVELPIQVLIEGHKYGEESYYCIMNTEFTFEISSSDAAPKPEGAGISLEESSGVWQASKKSWRVNYKESRSEDLSFGTITITEPGIYTYSLQQRASDNAYFDYDLIKHSVKVVVEADEKKELEAKLYYDDEETDCCRITNAYQAGELTLNCHTYGIEAGKSFSTSISFTNLYYKDKESNSISYYYADRLNCMIIRSDGETEPAKINSGVLKGNLMDGDKMIVIGIPMGATYSASANNNEGYVLRYKNERGSITTDDSEIEVDFYGKETLTTSFILESKLKLQGTKYKTNDLTYGDFPDKPEESEANEQAEFYLELEAKDDDAPMPRGTRNHIYKDSCIFSRMEKHAISETGAALFKTMTLKPIITFTENDLQGNEKRVFHYIARHGEDNQERVLPYIVYNTDTISRKYKEVEVKVTLQKTSDGKLLATQNIKPIFNDRYVSGSITLENQITNGEAKPSSILLSLKNQSNKPINGWKLFVDIVKEGESERQSTAVITDKNGCVSFESLQGEQIVVYGIPNQTRYEITATVPKGDYPEFITQRIVGDKIEVVAEKDILNLDKETTSEIPDGRIHCLIKNKHIKDILMDLSTITLPAQTTTILKGALSGTAAEVYVLPEKIKTIQEGAFDDLPNARFIVVPENAKTPDRSLFPADVLLIRPDGMPVE